MIDAATLGALATMLAPLYLMVFKLNRQVGELCSSVENNTKRLDRHPQDD